MNTINDKHNVAFGLKFTPSAINFLTENIEKIAEPCVVRNMDSDPRIINPLEIIDAFSKHEKSHDLTVDIEKATEKSLGIDRAGYNVVYSFTKGPEDKKALKVFDFRRQLDLAIESINLKNIARARKDLKVDYSQLKKVKADAKEKRKLSRLPEVKARFAQGSAKLISALRYSAEDLKNILKEAPERFSFKVVQNNNEGAKLYAATPENPFYSKFEPDDVVYAFSKPDEMKDIEYFEKYHLKPENKKVMASLVRKTQLQAIISKPKTKTVGLAFSPEAQNAILSQEEISPEELAGFKRLANRKSSKNLMLHFNKDKNYYAFVSKNKQNDFVQFVSTKYSNKELLDSINSKDFLSMVEKNEKAAVKENKFVASQVLQMNDLVNTDAFKNRFVGDSAVIAVTNAKDINIRYLKYLSTSPKLNDFTFKVEMSKAQGRSVVYVASKKYPKAGFVELHDYVTRYAFENINQKLLMRFREYNIKQAHEKQVNIEAAKERLKNIFAGAENSNK